MRTNRFNDGRAFQQEVERSAGRYVGLLRIRKADPPVRVLGGGPSRRVIFIEPEFTDFIGVWTERGGRGLFIECKSTSEPKLPFGNGGVTDKQIDLMYNWGRSGAVAFVLWEWRGHGVRLVWDAVFKQRRDRARSGEGLKHLKWEEFDGYQVEKANGWLTVDFLPVMRKVWA